MKNFFLQPLTFTSRFTLPSRAILSPLEGIMNRDNFFRSAIALNLIDSWMPPFIGIPKDAPPKRSALRKRFKLFLESGIPFTVQILGHDPDSMGEACRTLFDFGVSSVNVNCACPSATVISSGSGAALLRQPELMRQILQTIRAAVPDLCLSVKLRSGFDSAEELPEILSAVREGGAHWVIHHFRTASENYAEIPRIEAVRRLQKVRELLPRTIFFANGDIDNATVAELYRKECACDGIAIGRGILRNPFLLRTILTGENPSVDLRREFLKLLTHGIVNRRRDHFQLECVKMAYGEDSFEFTDCLKSIQNHKSLPR
ncbi:MAG: tRNA-dihydrouridine synthase family protein [Lentisphaeria bacterium]|nr:tRNA-dihydrouridine synthase family protein [Lentisphaeria bacterium]